jgi:small subunit ribosomal protein S13
MSMYINLTKPKLKSKKLIYALKSVYGINLTLAKNVCKVLGYDINMKINECRDQDLVKISSIINLYLKFLFSDELKKNIYDNIQKMKIIKSYKGIRHSYGLPVNGQRTRTNARTRKWRQGKK